MRAYHAERTKHHGLSLVLRTVGLAPPDGLPQHVLDLAIHAAELVCRFIAEGNLNAFDYGPLTAEEQATLFRVRRDNNTTGA